MSFKCFQNYLMKIKYPINYVYTIYNIFDTTILPDVTIVDVACFAFSYCTSMYTYT